MDIERWQDLKFGVLIHWGPYAQLGVVESWTLCQEPHAFCRAPGDWADDPAGYEAFYEKLPDTFDAPSYNPDIWAESCARAGMRYVVFTTKHHDGFNMFDTALSDYKVTKTPLGRDITHDVLSRFRGRGLHAGVYYSKADWHSEDYWVRDRPRPSRSANYSVLKEPERWERFKKFTRDQVRELLTKYGPIDILWLDAGWVRAPGEDLDMPAMALEARTLQPGILVVDRSVPGPQEDYQTPEQTIPEQFQPYPWESCVSLGAMWYASKFDQEYKSVTEVVHMLCRVTARGGNLLLGVGPDHTGAFPPIVHDRLSGVGTWLDANSPAIYGTRPVPPYEKEGVLFTSKEEIVYIISLLAPEDRPPESADLPWDGGKPNGVHLLGSDSPVKWEWRAPDGTETGGRILVEFPNIPIKHAYVLAVHRPGATSWRP